MATDTLINLCHRLILEPSNKSVAKSLNKELIRSGLLSDDICVREDKAISKYYKDYGIVLNHIKFSRTSGIFYTDEEYYSYSPLPKVLLPSYFSSLQNLRIYGCISSLEFLQKLNLSSTNCLDLSNASFTGKTVSFIRESLKIPNLMEIQLPGGHRFYLKERSYQIPRIQTYSNSAIIRLLKDLKKIRSNREFKVKSFFYSSFKSFSEYLRLNLNEIQVIMQEVAGTVDIPFKFSSTGNSYFVIKPSPE